MARRYMLCVALLEQGETTAPSVDSIGYSQVTCLGPVITLKVSGPVRSGCAKCNLHFVPTIS